MFLEASLSKMEGNLHEHRTALTSTKKPKWRTLHRLEPIFTYQHLIHDDAQAPPITELVISILHEDLWCDVVWGPHGGECLTRRRRTFMRLHNGAEY